ARELLVEEARARVARHDALLAGGRGAGVHRRHVDEVQVGGFLRQVEATAWRRRAVAGRDVAAARVEDPTLDQRGGADAAVLARGLVEARRGEAAPNLLPIGVLELEGAGHRVAGLGVDQRDHHDAVGIDAAARRPDGADLRAALRAANP